MKSKLYRSNNSGGNARSYNNSNTGNKSSYSGKSGNNSGNYGKSGNSGNKSGSYGNKSGNYGNNSGNSYKGNNGKVAKVTQSKSTPYSSQGNGNKTNKSTSNGNSLTGSVPQDKGPWMKSRAEIKMERTRKWLFKDWE